MNTTHIEHKWPLTSRPAPPALFCALIAIGVCGCAIDATESGRDEKVATTAGETFAEWRDSLPIEEPSGYRIVEDDMPMSETGLRAYYDSHFSEQDALLLHSQTNGGAPVSQFVWNAATRTNLTYCVSNNWNTVGPTAKQTVINELAWGTQQWQQATSNAVVFRYVPSEDANCTNANNNVLFNVDVNAPAGCPGAPGGNCCPSIGGNCGFFPDATDFPRSKRTLFFGQHFPADPLASENGYAAHELGHILGFGHEQSWLKGTPYACGAEEPTFLPLTRYDNNSIMHYGPCLTSTGANVAGPTADLLLSVWDKRGAQCAYEGLCEWIQIAGVDSVRDIDVNQKGDVWSFSNVIKDGGGYFLQLWNHSTLKWDPAPATPTGGVRLSVDPGGVPWYVTANHDIYRVSNGRVVKMPGAANDISVGPDGSVWAVTNTPIGGGFLLAKWNGSSWVLQTGFGVRISVDRTGAPFVLQANGSIWHLEAGLWTQWPGAAVDIDAGSDGSLWAIAPGGSIFQWNVAAGRWDLTTGAGSAIAVAQNGQPWVVGLDNATYINRWAP